MLKEDIRLLFLSGRNICDTKNYHGKEVYAEKSSDFGRREGNEALSDYEGDSQAFTTGEEKTNYKLFG